MARGEPLIVLASVAKDYVSGAGVVHALREIELTIDEGEFVAIVGTSGSGKSTLMNILGCLDRPTVGTYTLAGFDVGTRTGDGRAIVRNRLIGFIFQGFNLLARTTALENVELPLTYRGVGRAKRKERAMRALEAVGLGDRVHHTPNQLSGGQQQRVAIARALVTDPPLLLADEPTGNLDTRTSLEVLALLQRLNRDRGITICLVTHEQDIAACASRVIAVRDGRVVSDVRQANPINAAKELEELPPPDAMLVGQGLATSVTDDDRARLGPPLPPRFYAAMASGTLLGIALGVFYNQVILDARAVLIPVILSILAECFVAARYGARVFGKPLTQDQRVRAALGYTLGTSVVVALFLLVRAPTPMVARLAGLSGPGIAISVFVVLFGLVALALLRYLLVSFLSPRK